MPPDSAAGANAFNHGALAGGLPELRKFDYFAATGAKVLIVDDINANLKVMEGLLEPYKMQVDTCLSGEKAIEMVQEKKYDIVFMDQMMPDMDGIEAMKRIRALGGEFESLPILAQTANAMRGIKEMLMSQGFNDFISKPLETSKLHAILKAWIPKGKQSEGGAAETAPSESAGAGPKATVGHLEKHIETLALYCSDAGARLDEIPKYLKQNNLGPFVTIIHALKSASAVVGAPEISEMARALEDAGNNKDMAYIERETGSFLSALKIALGEISIVAPNSGPGNKNDDIGIACNKLESLKDAMLNNGIGAIDKIVLALKNSQFPNFMEQLSQSVLISDFDKAVRLIDNFLAASRWLTNQDSRAAVAKDN
jgi:CheY-like chemotaxis protein/HPt (histidine-containing phosphotransfer) domain-containing protein